MEDRWKEFHFSYSGLTTFEQCPYAFKLTYIDKLERTGNFFSSFGNFCHLIIEKYFKKELEVWDLLDYYKSNYQKEITELPPPFINTDIYYQAGYDFFENFDLDREDYDIIDVEDFVKGMDQGIGFIIKPDLIFKEKSSDDIIIMDFKTSEVVNKYGKLDEEKLNGYKKQIGIYIHYIWLFKGIEIKKAKLWFIRSNTFYNWDYNQYENIDNLEWVKSVVENIRIENKWVANTSNKFFCCNLCGVSQHCEYKKC